MPPDEKSPQPPEKPTTQLPAVPAWAIELTRSVKDGFAKMDANITLISSDLEVVKGRVGNLEEARRVDEARQTKHSGGLTRESQINADQSAAIGSLVADMAVLKPAVTELKTAVDEGNDLTSDVKRAIGEVVKKNPQLVSNVIIGALTLVTTVLGFATAWFAAKGH